MRKAITRKTGFTLVEVLVSILVFSIFSVALVATMGLVMRWWFKIKDPEMAEQNARMAAHIIADDFRQALPNPTDSSTLNTPIKQPSSGTTGSTLQFYEPISAGSLGKSVTGAVVYDPSQTNFTPSLSTEYQLVTYSVGTNSGGNACILRSVSVNGVFVNNNETGDPIVSMTTNQTGTLSLQITGKSSKQVVIQVSCAEPSEIGQGVLHTCTLVATTFCQN